VIRTGDFSKVPWIVGSTSQETAEIVACEYWALACREFSFSGIKPTEITSWRFRWILKFPGTSRLVNLCSYWLLGVSWCLKLQLGILPRMGEVVKLMLFYIHLYTQDHTMPLRSASHEELKVVHRLGKRGLIFIYSTDSSWR
jgi:hypothetical protein